MERTYLRGPWGVTSGSKLWLSACDPHWLSSQTSHLGVPVKLSFHNVPLIPECPSGLLESLMPSMLWWLVSSPALSFLDRHSRMVHLHCQFWVIQETCFWVYLWGCFLEKKLTKKDPPWHIFLWVRSTLLHQSKVVLHWGVSIGHRTLM